MSNAGILVLLLGWVVLGLFGIFTKEDSFLAGSLVLMFIACALMAERT